MKNTAPPRALRGWGLTGATPPMPIVYYFPACNRGGCGRHEPPPKGLLRASIRDMAAWGKPRKPAREGKPMQAGPATPRASRQKRSEATNHCAERSESPEGKRTPRPKGAGRAPRGACRMARPVARGAQERDKRNAAKGRERDGQPDNATQSNNDARCANTALKDMKTTGECGGGNEKRQPRTRRRGKGGPTPSRGRRNFPVRQPIAAYEETQRDRRAKRHSAARVARGRASSRSGTRSARGYGGGGAPADAQPSAAILCAARRASVASPIPAAYILFLSVFFLVGSVVIHIVDFSSLSASGAPRRGARPRGRAFRPRAC